MATFTRSNLVDIAKGHVVVEQMTNGDIQKIRNAVNAITSSLVARGLTYQETKNTHEAGRAEHEYSAANLYPRLWSFMDTLKRDTSLMWAVGNAIIDHLEFIGYTHDGDHFVVPKNGLSKGDLSYIHIFGREAFEEKKKREEEAAKRPNPWA
jgi:hypothetical protein